MKPFYFICWCLFRAFFALFFRCRVYNPERVPASGPVVLACNHASLLDPPIVGAGTTRMINYLAKESLFKIPVFATILKHWQVVPVDREGGGAKGLRAIMDRLLHGGAVILFPEGTRTLDGKLQPARSGIGLLVVKTKGPVLPVRVFGTFDAMGKGRVFPKPVRVAVKYGRPIYFEELRAEAAVCSKQRLKEIYQEIADQIMQEIAKLGPWEDKAAFP